jgi:DNA-binding protein HU-beta
MPTVTKRDLVAAVSSSTGLNADDIATMLNSLITVIGDRLSEGNAITLRGLCTFSVKVSRAKKGRNPRQPNELFDVPEHCSLRFSPSKELKDRVKMLSPQKVQGY